MSKSDKLYQAVDIYRSAINRYNEDSRINRVMSREEYESVITRKYLEMIGGLV